MNKYKVWDPDGCDEDGAQIIEAVDIEHAAAKYAEENDADRDYYFSNGDGVNLLVRKVGGNTIASVIAYGESTIDYGARITTERDFE